MQSEAGLVNIIIKEAAYMKKLLFFTCFFIITSAISLHSQSAGKIVFSKSPIDPAKPAGLTTNFKAGDTIYGLASLPDTIRNLSGNPSAKRTSVEIVLIDDDDISIYTGGTAGEAASNRKYFTFDILPDPSNMSAYVNNEVEYKKYPNPAACDGPIRIAETFRRLQPGTYSINVSVKVNYREAAKGSFTIEGNNYSAYGAMMTAMISGADSGAAESARMPQAKMKNNKTEADMIKAIKNSNDWKTGRIKANKEIISLVIIDPEWMVRRHNVTNAILHRYIRAAAAVKDSKGECWVYPQITFQEDYSGGKYLPLKYDGAGDMFKIQCGNINK